MTLAAIIAGIVCLLLPLVPLAFLLFAFRTYQRLSAKPSDEPPPVPGWKVEPFDPTLVYAPNGALLRHRVAQRWRHHPDLALMVDSVTGEKVTHESMVKR